ncbi:hypothetical protein O1611_g9721 [Lasiodiplodia mahajangana]|uniref:Uncharacterized protein n=1 Tax=Lasiodiplodia mahajangana TaxID=1108764 RepID=A0ACC2J5Z5_9PEZI|nr:hypothetical protein O1611_g9721 [Lasiodiplodia mahajangana]
MTSVPRTHQVVPGAQVNIVLKADQRTGRQVRGTVQNVLTRGDHHRGIKVRLTDGRIGRVQSMATGVESGSSTQPYPSQTSTENSNPNPSTFMTPENENAREPRGQGRRPRYRDIRLEEPLDVPPEQTDLSTYIVPSRRKGRGKKGANASQAHEAGDPEDSSNRDEYGATVDVASATATCPVCGAFEGDETAVAHHVADHFGS